MARLTIEESWWTDPRREKLGELVGGMVLADAVVIRLWRLAQEYWGRGRKPIPHEVFEHVQAAPKLVQAGLAKVQEDGVYVTGSTEFIDWLNEKREAGSKGGKKSATRPRDAKGRLLKNSKQEPSTSEAESNCVQTSGSGSGFGSGSDSDLGSGKNREPSIRANEFLDGYSRRFKHRYGTNPQIQGKDAGIASRLVKNLSKPKAELLLDAYFAMPDSILLKAKHPLNLFELKMNEVVVYANTGAFTTQRQARQADDTATTHELLRQVREGSA